MKTIITFLIIHSSIFVFNCFAQQTGWEIVSSGTSEELNSIFFYDYEFGFACGNSGTVIKSIDSGKTWQNLSTPVTNDLNDLYVFNDSTLCVVGDSGTILFSVEGGNNWYVGPYFLTENYYSMSFSETKGILGGSSQTIVQADFGGTNIGFFEIQSGFFGGGFWGAFMLSPQFGFVAGENSIFQPLFGKSLDSGINWDFTAFYLNNNEGRATGVDFTDINTGYISASVWDGTGAIAKTTNGGSNWISTMFTNPLWSVDFPISSASQVGYAAGSQGTILKTYNAGANWLQQISGTNLKLNKVHFKDFDFGFAVGENGIILRTTIGGDPIPIELINFTADAVIDKVILNWSTATETNNQGFEVLRSAQNDNSSWKNIGFVEGKGTTTEIQSYSFTDEPEPGIYKYRLKQIDFDGTFAYSPEVEAEVKAPNVFSLEQNYPNPFNPITKIKFTIPVVETRHVSSLQMVTLKVYDILGNEIVTLVNEEKPAGEYEVEFDGSDLPSGIYFYQLQIGDPETSSGQTSIQTKKMILLK